MVHCIVIIVTAKQVLITSEKKGCYYIDIIMLYSVLRKALCNSLYL